MKFAQESINQIDRQKQSFRQKSLFIMHFNEPIDQDAPHLIINLALLQHIVRIWQVLILTFKHLLRDAF